MLAAMSYIDEEIVETGAELNEKDKRKNRISFARRAAVLIISLICIGTTTGFAAWSFGINLKNKFTGSDRSEAELTVEVAKVPMEAFKGDIKGLFENDMFINSSDWSMQFASVDEAVEYLGIEGLKKNELQWEEKEVKLRSLVNKERLYSLDLNVKYEVDGMNVLEILNIFTTEMDDDELTVILQVNTEAVFKEEEYVTESGKHALIMTRENVKGEKYDGKMVFMLEGSVLYNCIVNYDGNEEEKQAESLIKEWLEQF